jgi:Tfp pilus assembly protein PilO
MKKRSIFFVFILFSILIVLVVSVFWQERMNIALKKGVVLRKEELQEAQKMLQRLESLEKQAAVVEKKRASLVKQVPLKEKKPFEFIREISRLNSDLGLSGLKFKIQKREELVDAGVSLPVNLVQGQLPQEVKITVTFECVYPQLVVFLERLYLMSRLVDVSEIVIERQDSKIPYHKVILTLAVYTFP